MHAIKASNNAVLNGCSAFLERSSKYSIMVKTANAARNIGSAFIKTVGAFNAQHEIGCMFSWVSTLSLYLLKTSHHSVSHIIFIAHDISSGFSSGNI